MISIRRYLDMEPAVRRGPLESETTDTLQALLSGVLEAINQYVLTGYARAAERLKITQLKEAVKPGWSQAETLQAQNSISQILAEYSETNQRSATTLTVEMQHIFAMLNQALVVLAEGRDRSVVRLNKILEALSRISMIEDVVALKSRLAETVRFIEAESAEAHESAAQELAHLEKEVSRTREFLGGMRMELAGRPEGISRIEQSLKKVVAGEAVYLVAFRFDRLQAVSQRYGPGVADELVFRLIKERLEPVAPGEIAYRWTPASLVAVFRRLRGLDALRAEVANLNATALVHRIALGNRTAVMTVTPSHLVAEGMAGPPGPLVEQVDQFAGVVGA
jgi:hypothetical protein